MPSHGFLLGAGIGAGATLFACTYLFLHLMHRVLEHDIDLLRHAADRLEREEAPER